MKPTLHQNGYKLGMEILLKIKCFATSRRGVGRFIKRNKERYNEIFHSYPYWWRKAYKENCMKVAVVQNGLYKTYDFKDGALVSGDLFQFTMFVEKYDKPEDAEGILEPFKKYF